MMKFENRKAISEIKKENDQLAEKDAKIVQLENEVANAKEVNLIIMEATAEVYEENLRLKDQLLNTMEAVAIVYEELLALKSTTGGN